MEEVKEMKKVNLNEMRSVDAGASKYVTCPICGYSKKTDLFSRLFETDTKVEYYLSARHYKAMSGYNKSQSVHY